MPSKMSRNIEIKAQIDSIEVFAAKAATLADEAKWQESKQALARALEVDPGNAGARKLSQELAEAHPGP